MRALLTGPPGASCTAPATHVAWRGPVERLSEAVERLSEPGRPRSERSPQHARPLPPLRFVAAAQQRLSPWPAQSCPFRVTPQVSLCCHN